MMHYLNNSGAGLLSDDTLQIIVDYYKQEQSVGAYQAAKDNKKQFELFYQSVASLINARSSDEIAFVDSASRGWNLAVYGANLSRGDNIITLSSEFGTNLITLYDLAKKIGAHVHVIPCHEDGSFDLSKIGQLLEMSNKKVMIAVSQAAAQGSIVNPVVEIGALARRYGAIYIVDGCQSVGQIPVDVQAMNCDAFVTSGRKWLCGPRGTGFLYVKSQAQINPTQLDLVSADLVLDEKLNVNGVKIRNDAKKFEIWERNYAAVLGLLHAIEIINAYGIKRISSVLSEKANEIRSIIAETKSLHLIGKKESKSGIVGFYADNASYESHIIQALNENGLIYSTMNDWDFPLSFPRNGVSNAFRLSPHYFTEQKTIDIACQTISRL